MLAGSDVHCGFVSTGKSIGSDAAGPGAPRTAGPQIVGGLREDICGKQMWETSDRELWCWDLDQNKLIAEHVILFIQLMFQFNKEPEEKK